MKAVIMAGGFGTRLRPLTNNIPKPIVPLVNKPVMEHIIDLLREQDIKDIVVILYHQPEIIETYFGDGSDFGVNISYVAAERDLGTAGSVRNAEEYLKDTFLIMSGDVLTDFDLNEVIDFHRKKGAMATVNLTRVEDPSAYGVVITDDDGRIRRFLEKPSWGEVFSDTVNTGIYILEPEVLKYVPPQENFDFSKDLYPILLENGDPLLGYVAGGYWKDIGDLIQYRRAHYDILEGKVKVVDIPGEEIRRGVWVGRGVDIDPTARIYPPAIVGDNVRIKEEAQINELTVIGANSIIGREASLSRSIIWNNVFIGDRAELRGCVIGRHCNIREGTSIDEGAAISDECTLGKESIIKSNVKIWPGKVVDSGATVTMSLVWGGEGSKTLFKQRGITGLSNIEISPDFAAKLGAAYGTMLDKSALVLTGRGPHRSARMIKRAIIAGLLSAGINVCDLRTTPTSLLQHQIKSKNAAGGVHVRISPDDPHLVDIRFFDARGIDSDKSTERKIETLFFREDYRRVYSEEVGQITHAPYAIDYYSEDLLKSIDISLIKSRKFKVVIDYAYGSSSFISPSILGKLDCEVVALNAYVDEARISKTKSAFLAELEQVGSIVRTLKADMGVVMDPSAEQLFLIDEKGRRLSDYSALALASLLILKAEEGGTIAIPVTVPSYIEEIASSYGGKVIRTQANPRSLMMAAAKERVVFAGDGKGGFIFPNGVSVFDAIFSFVKLFELIAKEGKAVSEIVELFPPIHIAMKIIPCPWELKGKVMRKTMEDSRDRTTELIDGVKIYHDHSWILVLPDADEPLVRVYGEAESDESRDALLDEYVNRIEKVVNGD